MSDRLKHLQQSMSENNMDMAVLMNPRDIYYYTGTAQPCNFFVPKEGEPLLQVRRAWEFVIEEVSLPQSRLVRGAGLDQLEKMIEELPFPVETIGLSMDVIPAKLYVKIKKTFPKAKIVDVSPLILRQRSIKDRQEIELIRKTAELYTYLHETIMENLRPGITELQMASLIVKTLREHEGETIIRNRRWDANLHPDGFVSCSKTSWRISGSALTVTGIGLSPSLAWGASTTVISQGDLVVFDIPLNRHGYHADVARTYVVGKADARQKEMFSCVVRIQDAALAALKSGIPAENVYLEARQRAEELGVEQYFQGYGDNQGTYIGHGVGLEVDEPPTLQLGEKTIMEDGMVVTLEPKLIIPEWGATFIEDCVIVTAAGNELIETVPRELFEIV